MAATGEEDWHLQRAEDAVHDGKGDIHQDPLLFAQVALDLVQDAAEAAQNNVMTLALLADELIHVHQFRCIWQQSFSNG